MSTLEWITYTVNLLGLVLGIWLGLYLVSRSPRHLIAWLTALTLWSMAGLYFNVLLEMIPPPLIKYHPTWLRLLFPIWPPTRYEGVTIRWIAGWSVVPAIAFWHHATTLMLPGKLTYSRQLRIVVGYLLALVSIAVQVRTPVLIRIEEQSPLYLNTLRANFWYPVIGAVFVILILLSVTNLIRAARAAPPSTLRKQFETLAAATLVAGLTIPTSIAGSVLGWSVPLVSISLLEVIPVMMIGYGVARYSALMEGRTIRRDFAYNLGLLGVILLIYLLASFYFVRIYYAPEVLLVFLPLLAVITHFVMSSVSRFTDWLFFHRQTRLLRDNLQELAQLADEGDALQEYLEQAVESLSISVHATYCLILTFDDGTVWQAAAYHWTNGKVELNPAAFSADDVTHLAPNQLPPPLAEASLLMPLYGENDQLGALVLGQPTNGIRYANQEVERVINFSDRIGDVLSIARRRSDTVTQVARLADADAMPLTHHPAYLPPESIETALRNLYDYSYLADSPLAKMQIARQHLPDAGVTHLEVGKAVHDLLLAALGKLRPESEAMQQPPQREWFPYLILRNAYLEGMPNREIMQRLYISEGTFNRTRRAAIRSLARALGEMETARHYF